MPGKTKKEPGAKKEPGTFGRLRETYSMVKTIDPKVGWWVGGAALVTFLILLGVGVLFGTPTFYFFIPTALAAAFLAAVLMLNRRANRAMYSALDGQVGATAAALQGMGKRGWYSGQEPVAVDGARSTKATELRNAALVFRAVGRPGVVLVAEGPGARARRALKAEERKTARLAPGVPIHTFVIGDGDADDEIPLSKLSAKLTRMRPNLSKSEVSVVNKRLTSLGTMNPGIPKGVDPTKARMDRKSLRGR